MLVYDAFMGFELEPFSVYCVSRWQELNQYSEKVFLYLQKKPSTCILKLEIINLNFF